MRTKKLKRLCTIFFTAASALLFCSWGTWGHHYINKAAVFSLPAEMRVFFYNHADFVTEGSVVPDLRKYVLKDKQEGPKHYIDVEDYGMSIDSLPKTMAELEALNKTKDLKKAGSLPWVIMELQEKLTKAFQKKNKSEILFISAELGHYIGDAHMPLHTTSNHDGQLTNQKGVHAFWESELPERFGSAYNFSGCEAKLIPDISKETWRIIKNSHALVDTLLAAEKTASSNFPEDKKFMKDEKGEVKKNEFGAPVHTLEYAKFFHDKLNGMVEKQMRLSVIATSSFWYTAWVNAGKPDLNSLDDEALTKANKKNYEEELKEWKKGKITKLKIESEFAK